MQQHRRPTLLEGCQRGILIELPSPIIRYAQRPKPARLRQRRTACEIELRRHRRRKTAQINQYIAYFHDLRSAQSYKLRAARSSPFGTPTDTRGALTGQGAVLPL